jgi:hypothetical protein
MSLWIVGGIILLGLLIWAAQKRGWIDLSNKARTGGSGGSLVNIGDEVFAPSRHEAQVELDRQTVLPAPAPVAGDGDKGIAVSDDVDEDDPDSRFDGRIRIDL